MSEVSGKVCTKCGEWKEFGEFSKNKTSKDGFQSYCKQCNKEYRETNKGRYKEYMKEYCKINRESVNAHKRKYYELNKERFRYYYKSNKERLKKSNKQYFRGYYKSNKQYFREYMKEYYKNNKERYSAHRASRRAARLQATPKWLTEEQKQAIYDIYKERQWLCDITGFEFHVDHIVPLQGKTVCGLHVPWNLDTKLASDNISKNNSLPDEKDYLAYIKPTNNQ